MTVLKKYKKREEKDKEMKMLKIIGTKVYHVSQKE